MRGSKSVCECVTFVTAQNACLQRVGTFSYVNLYLGRELQTHTELALVVHVPAAVI